MAGSVTGCDATRMDGCTQIIIHKHHVWYNLACVIQSCVIIYRGKKSVVKRKPCPLKHRLPPYLLARVESLIKVDPLMNFSCNRTIVYGSGAHLHHLKALPLVAVPQYVSRNSFTTGPGTNLGIRTCSTPNEARNESSCGWAAGSAHHYVGPVFKDNTQKLQPKFRTIIS